MTYYYNIGCKLENQVKVGQGHSSLNSSKAMVVYITGLNIV